MTATKVTSDRFKVSSLLARQLGEHKLSAPDALRRAGMPAGFFQQEKIYATTVELFAPWRAIGETSADPAIGLKLGAEPRFERYQPTAIAAVCSRTFRDALQRIARYKQITCPEEIRVRTSADEASVEFIYLQAQEVQPDVMVDLVLSWIFAIGRRGTDGQITPLRLELTRAVQSRELLESHFGCRVRFKATRNALIFRNTDLDRPFVTQNEELLKAIGAQLEAELQERNASADLGEQVKHSLKRSLAGKRPTLQHVARELCVSARTLQRRLTEADITFQRLVEETRRELAHHYLKHSTVELNEAAFLLGYGDANSFFRAFHGWEGTSPGEWRTKHRGVEPGVLDHSVYASVLEITKRSLTMDIKRVGSQPSTKGPRDWFSGTVRVDSPFKGTEPSRVAGATVSFEPGARTAWHTHPLGQTLIVTAGCGWAQRRGGPVEEIRPGDIVWFPPGEKHWHGAAPTTAMSHIAIQEALDGEAVDWLEKVTDDQYQQPQRNQ